MIDIHKILTRKQFTRQFRSTFGVNYKEFLQILHVFSILMQEQRDSKNQERLQSEWRKRKSGGGTKSRIPTAEGRLAFVLFYLKQYPTFDALGALYGYDGSYACRLFYSWYPLLKDTLKQLDVLPADSFEKAEDLLTFLQKKDVGSLLIDATERTIQRPAHDQKEYYSGKKKDIPSKTL